MTIISRIVDFSNYETSQTLVVTTNQIDDQVEGNISITAFLSDASDDILISEPNKVVVIVIPGECVSFTSTHSNIVVCTFFRDQNCKTWWFSGSTQPARRKQLT